jgi:hypothetical protein
MSKSFSISRIECDLTVVGGGIAGCCAAIAAARLGSSVALVNNRPVLGGNASSELGLLIGSADRDFPHARESGIAEEINLLNRYFNHEIQWRNSVSDATLENLVKEAGVQIFLNVQVDELEMDSDKRIARVYGSQQATEKRFEFTSPLFLDATGDGTIAALAGATYRTGTEVSSEFKETYAPEEATSVTMGSTLMYRIKDVGRPVPFVRPSWAHHYPDTNDLPVRIKDLHFPQLWIEYGARIDTIKDSMHIREELLKILYGVWDHIKNHGDYKADNFVLAWVGSVPGKRESRRVEGDYILNQNDLVDSTQFDDAVAFGGWPVDVHNPDGFAAREKWTDYIHLKEPYQIPYRCYYSRDIDNLFLAGRIISTTHVAHGSIRLMGTCAAGGQAVGTAAHLCHQHGMLPRELGTHMIAELQQVLLKYDAHIPGVTNQDSDDLARQADVKASTEYTDPATGYVYSADRVIEGTSRGRVDDENLWISKPITAFYKACLDFTWDQPIAVNCVHLTFDTMMREQRMFDKFILGAMYTCVSDYSIHVLDEDGNWQTVATGTDNFLRHNVVRFDSVPTQALRVQIDKTNGDDLARVYEVRVYDEE